MQRYAKLNHQEVTGVRSCKDCIHVCVACSTCAMRLMAAAPSIFSGQHIEETCWWKGGHKCLKK